MTTTTFLILLSGFAALSAVVTEAIKKLTNDKKNLSYNLLALCVAIVIGGVGTAVYYQLNGIVFTMNNTIYLLLMGLSSGLASMVGYDKVSQLIKQLTKNDLANGSIDAENVAVKETKM